MEVEEGGEGESVFLGVECFLGPGGICSILARLGGCFTLPRAGGAVKYHGLSRGFGESFVLGGESLR